MSPFQLQTIQHRTSQLLELSNYTLSLQMKRLREKMKKTPLGKIFLFLVFVSTTSLYMVFYKMTKIRDYYEDRFQKTFSSF